MPDTSTHPEISAKTILTLGQIDEMDHSELVACWKRAFERPAPRHISRPLMRRALAHRLQITRSRDITRRERTKLLRHARGDTRTTANRLAPGGRLVREWNGISHTVEVLESGFEWQGTPFRSLSSIAQAITGSHWSGPRFFGLTTRAGRSVGA